MTIAGSQISACRERCTRRSCRLAGPLLGQPRVDAPLCLLLADVLHPRHHRPPLTERVAREPNRSPVTKVDPSPGSTAPCSSARAHDGVDVVAGTGQVEWLTSRVPPGPATSP